MNLRDFEHTGAYIPVSASTKDFLSPRFVKSLLNRTALCLGVFLWRFLGLELLFQLMPRYILGPRVFLKVICCSSLLIITIVPLGKIGFIAVFPLLIITIE